MGSTNVHLVSSGHLRPNKPKRAFFCSASQQLSSKTRPDWTGDAILSRIVNAAIDFKPLYNIMKVMAKQTMQNSAEKNGVPWRQRVKELYNTPEVFQIKEEIENGDLEYPSYYLKPFHAYEKGNLDWTAAFENESATSAMAWRVFKEPNISPEQAQHMLRSSIHQHLEAFGMQHGSSKAEAVLDAGCSVGVSSRAFAERYPTASVTGLDLSPHFLAVAEHRERSEDTGKRRRVKYVHGLAESTGIAAESLDVYSLCFVIHECPPFAIEAMMREAMRILKPKGRIVIVDNDPMSKTIQNLPPFLFTLMKSTEPWSDEYYQMDVEAAMRKLGFEHVKTKDVDHRHRAVLGLKP